MEKIADFVHNKLFFLISRGICIIFGPVRSLAQPCAVNNTFFSLWEGQKWGFFAKDRTYRAFLHNKLFFSDSPEGFALLLGQCAAFRSQQHFFNLWEGQKWGFFAKDRTYRAFQHNKLFFLIAPRDLRYY